MQPLIGCSHEALAHSCAYWPALLRTLPPISFRALCRTCVRAPCVSVCVPSGAGQGLTVRVTVFLRPGGSSSGRRDGRWANAVSFPRM
eukprot:6174514-Pleurochrysis_carterae.AAC.3